MKLVVDANILISAMIKRSKTLELLFDDAFDLFVPEYLFEEIENHLGYISKKSGLSKNELTLLFDSLKLQLTIVPSEEFRSYLKEAAKISPDIKDIPYLALCKKLNVALWSNDKALKEQIEIKVLSTKEIIGYLIELKHSKY
jgi:predicted nucleic acid-binding protein